MKDCAPEWKETWYAHELVFFVIKLQKIQLFLSDRWNKIDALMIILFVVRKAHITEITVFNINSANTPFIRMHKVKFSLVLVAYFRHG